MLIRFDLFTRCHLFRFELMRESSINWVGDLRAAVNCVSIFAAEGVSILSLFEIHAELLSKRKSRFEVETVYLAVFANFGN